MIKYENSQTPGEMKSSHKVIFRFKILKWSFDNFGAGGCIVEVLTEMLIPILTYGIFVICHLSCVIYDINVKYVIYWRWHMTYMSKMIYANMGVKSYVRTIQSNLQLQSCQRFIKDIKWSDFLCIFRNFLFIFHVLWAWWRSTPN